MSQETKTSVPESHQPDGSQIELQSITRREFLRLAALTSAGLVLAACAPSATPAPSGGATTAPTAVPQVSTGGGELNFLTWKNFVPEMDDKLDELAKKWGDQNKVKVTVEHININDIPTRRAAAVQAKTGPDVIFDTQNWPQLFTDSLVDVTDIVTRLDTDLKGVHEAAKPYSFVNGQWKAVPNAWGGWLFVYRTDWFKQNGVTVPKTWDDFAKAAAVLKKFGKPFGQALGHSFGDPPSFWYPWLWAWGGKEVAADGKTVALDSAESVTAVEKAVELYKTGLLGQELAWDDSSNNKSYAAEEISCTGNGPSIYFVAVRDSAKDPAAKRVADNSDHFIQPSGPKGQFALISVYSLGIMNYSKNVPAAKNFVAWLHQPDQYNAWMDAGRGYLQGIYHAYDDAKIFQSDPKMTPYQDLIKANIIKWVGWPGPLSAQSFKAYTNFYIVDMFANACSGKMTPKDAVKSTADQLSTVYKG